jgi:hypothetical protein
MRDWLKPGGTTLRTLNIDDGDVSRAKHVPTLAVRKKNDDVGRFRGGVIG